MPNFQTETGTEAKTKVSPAIGLAVVALFGAAGAVAMLMYGSSLNRATNTSTTTKVTNTAVTPVDLTNSSVYAATETMATEYDRAIEETNAIVQPSDVTIRITAPAEGAIINDVNGNFVTAELTDPNHKVASLYVRTFNDRYKIMIGRWNLTTSPYTWNTALSLYPSGEYRDVVYARDASGKFIAWADIMYTKAHDCYYLAYQDVTLKGPTSSVTAGTSFTMTATIKNNMRGACQNVYDVSTNSTDTFESMLPEGWTSNITPPSPYTMGVNETKSFTISVKVPLDALANTYTVGVSTRRRYTGFIASPTTTVTVIRPTTGGGGGGVPREVE